MSKTIAVVLAACLLAGCATSPGGNYLKPTATDAEINKDRFECLQAAQQPVTSAYANAYGARQQGQMVTNPDIFDACVKARGYRWVPNKQS